MLSLVRPTVWLTLAAGLASGSVRPGVCAAALADARESTRVTARRTAEDRRRFGIMSETDAVSRRPSTKKYKTPVGACGNICRVAPTVRPLEARRGSGGHGWVRTGAQRSSVFGLAWARSPGARA